MRLWFVGVIHAVTLHTTAMAHAHEQTWRLEYRRGPNAPSNCPDEDYLRTLLSTRIGARDPFSNDASRTITIELKTTQKRIEAHIHDRDENGILVSEAMVHTPAWRCDQLGEKIVFVLRDIVAPLSFQSKSESEQPAPAQSPTKQKEDATNHKVVNNSQKQPIRPASAHDSPRKPQLLVSVSAGVSWWNAPDIAFTSLFDLGARWTRFSVGIEGRYDYASRLPLQRPMQAEQLGIALVFCGYHTIAKTRIYSRGCLLGEVGRLWVQTSRALATEYASNVANLGARVGFGASLSRIWNIELHADGAYAVSRPHIAVDIHEDWRMPRFNGAIRANLVGLFDVF